MRAFIALNLPAHVRDELHQALEPLRGTTLPVRWVAPDALHLTLKFLGDIEGTEIDPIEQALQALAPRHAPPELDIGGVGAFPSRRRANVLWIGVVATPGLAALQRDVELACARLGYAREQRPFRPHITIGRTRSGSRPPDIERLAGAASFGARTIVPGVDLMRSHLGGEAARYEALRRIALGPGQ